MKKMPRGLRIIAVVLLFAAAFGLLRGIQFFTDHHTTSAAGVHQTVVNAHATVTIVRNQDLFEPFVLTIQPHTVVTWQNNDSVAHHFTTTPISTSQQHIFLNPQSFSLTVAANGYSTFVFTRPGLYHYYETAKDSWNSTFARVEAGANLRHYPMAMEGVIWVQGTLQNLPTTIINFVLHGHDMFASEFLAITPDGAVTWHNLDEDPHFVGLVDGWSAPINPVDIGLYRIAGTDDIPGGASVTVLFPTPGLYYYYCRNHDQVDAATHRVHALMMASEYPIPMEGFILVA
jgi:plastocyanin